MEEDDRRIAPRLDAIALVELSSETKVGRHGVTRNISEKGLLLATRSLFKAGDRLELAVHGKDGEIIRLNGRVVRVDETEPDVAWRYRVAIELDEALPQGLIEHGVQIATRLRGKTNPPPP